MTFTNPRSIHRGERMTQTDARTTTQAEAPLSSEDLRVFFGRSGYFLLAQVA